MRFFNHQEHDFSRIERGVFDDRFVDLVHRVSDLRAVSADGRLSHLIHPRQKELGCRSAEAFCVFNRRIKKFDIRMLGASVIRFSSTKCERRFQGRPARGGLSHFQLGMAFQSLSSSTCTRPMIFRSNS